MRSVTTKKLVNIKKIGVYIGVPGLGDFLFIIPLFRALKNAFPEAEVVFIGKLLREYVKPVFSACSCIDSLHEYYLYQKGSFRIHSDFVMSLRRAKYDIIVDTQRKFVPSLLLKLGGPKFMVSYGSRGFFSDFPVPGQEDRYTRHTADVSLDLARALGIEPSLELELTVPASHLDYAASFYSAAGITQEDHLLGLVPSAAEPSRCWPPERFATLADRLAISYGMKTICFGSSLDSGTIKKVAGTAKSPILVEDFSRGNVMDSAALIKRCSLVVGNISGPLHVADALGVPCAGIYGPHPPGRFGLLGKNSTAISLNMDCSPCNDPACEHRRCINDISVDMVVSSILPLTRIHQ